MKLEDLSISVQVDGKMLEEFETKDQDDGKQGSRTCYVESEVGKVRAPHLS